MFTVNSAINTIEGVTQEVIMINYETPSAYFNANITVDGHIFYEKNMAVQDITNTRAGKMAKTKLDVVINSIKGSVEEYFQKLTAKENVHPTWWKIQELVEEHN